MELNFAPFQDFIETKTTESTRERSREVNLTYLDVKDGLIYALAVGTKKYQIQIEFDDEQVIDAYCSCPSQIKGYCKHVVKTLVEADKVISKDEKYKQSKTVSIKKILLKNQFNKEVPFFVLNKYSSISHSYITSIAVKEKKTYHYRTESVIREGSFLPNKMLLKSEEIYNYGELFDIEIHSNDENLFAYCSSCQNKGGKICSHLVVVLKKLVSDKLFGLPFKEKERHEVLNERLKRDYGIEGVENPDELIQIELEMDRLFLNPKVELLNLNDDSLFNLKSELDKEFAFSKEKKVQYQDFIVVEKNDYSDDVSLSLMTAPISVSGQIKSPIEEAPISQRIRNTKDLQVIKFYSAFLDLSEYEEGDRQSVIDALQNPLDLPVYLDNREYSGYRLTPKNISPITVRSENPTARLTIKEKDKFYIASCQIIIDNTTYSPKRVELKGQFLFLGSDMYVVKKEVIANLIQLFKDKGDDIYIPSLQFPKFKEQILDKLENSVSISYSFVKPAPAKFVKEKAMNEISEKMIYLSESEDYILITPIVMYGDVEVPVLSKRSLHVKNDAGITYEVKRDERNEARFLRMVQTQHETFAELPVMDFFYLHKQEFLEDGWFIDAFENWRNENIAILGFNQLKNNRYNANKMKVSMSVKSGIDWFDIEAKASFGKENVTLKEIQKSILNKSRYVKLSDGTHGLLPTEWIDKFGHYFRSGEIKDGFLRTHKSNFNLIDELFDKEVLSEDVKLELRNYRDKLADFHSIQHVKVPKKLKATLRDYQKEGLNWLNFLDEFGFGGCLADDMGLGKTIQIIAYFLMQHEKGNKQPNLVILPTTLLFNWQKEVEKFAPHLKVMAFYGANRKKEKVDFSKSDIVLTTYGTLISDIEMLRKEVFNIIVLDESQAIKNPESKRYKAVRLLQGRQRLVVTGTPVENNTFDLYAQLSFAVPGLLGTSKNFQQNYSTPIDKFQDSQRAQELQQKVQPFILRRTKKQVATELPEKTEMIIYCEMGEEQRRVYETYKAEFQNYLANLSEDEMKKSSLHVLQGLTKLRQICNSPALLSDEEFYGEESSKLDELMEQIEQLKREHKILVFSQFVGMLDLIKKRLDSSGIRHAYLTGQTKNREEVVNSFQDEEDIRVFLISLKAGGTGLNLTQAEYVFIVDPWWNPAAENQAIDRAYRIGQTNKVIAVRLITPNTIEDKIMELKDRKKQLAEDLIHTDNNVMKKLSKEDLMKLI